MKDTQKRVNNKMNNIELIETNVADECLICGEEDCETIFKFNNKTEIHWFGCNPDDITFKQLVKLGIFEE